MVYGDYKCPHCRIVSTLKWDDEDSKWRMFVCWNCRKVVARFVCENLKVRHYWVVENNQLTELQLRQARTVYKELVLERAQQPQCAS